MLRNAHMKLSQISVVAIVTMAAFPATALTVRVQDTPGGPQIHLNGSPIAPRFFWGTPRGETFELRSEWNESHHFSQLTMQIRNLFWQPIKTVLRQCCSAKASMDLTYLLERLS